MHYLILLIFITLTPCRLLAKLMNLLPREEFQQRFGFTLAFMATHSGLTRWRNFPQPDNSENLDLSFIKMHPRTIDEIWYKRAVNQYYIQTESFIYSVPIDDSGNDNTTLVTASRAVFIGVESAKAPVAVVGFQFRLAALQRLFQNITFQCGNSSGCTKHCGDESMACYLLDNHGYIVAASNDEMDSGKFFGQVRGPVMRSLVKEKIYDTVQVFDYQAVCFMRTSNSNDGTLLNTPWQTIVAIFFWFFDQLAMVYAKSGMWPNDYAEAVAYTDQEDISIVDYQDLNEKATIETKDEKMFDQKVLINKTRPEPCDQEARLYLLNPLAVYNVDSTKSCKRPYVAQPVNLSNMILVVVDLSACHETQYPTLSVTPTEVEYGNNTMACQKAQKALYRKRPQSCIRTHPKESEIKDLCGLASAFRLDYRLLLFFPFIIYLFTKTPIHL